MKKSLFLILSLMALFFVSCESTSEIVDTEETSNGNFKSTYDLVSDTTTIEHDDLSFSVYGIYNLQDSPWTGERENIRIELVNNIPVVCANIQGSKWLYLEEVLFIDADTKTRLSLKDGHRTSDVISSSALRESYRKSLDQEQTETLKQILSGTPQVCFIGSEKRTDLFEIKPKLSKPMLEILNYTQE